MGSPAAPLVGLHADLDGSGTLSRAEVWAHLSQHSSWTSERVEHLVKALDRDGSGEIPVDGWDALIALLEQPSSSQSCARPSPQPSPATPQPSPPPPGSGSTHCTDGEPHCAAPPPSAVLRRSVSLQVRQAEEEEAAPERPSSGFFRAAPWVPKPGRPPRDNAMFIRADSCAASGPGGAPGSREVWHSIVKPSSASSISNGELDPCDPDFTLNLTLGPWRDSKTCAGRYLWPAP